MSDSARYSLKVFLIGAGIMVSAATNALNLLLMGALGFIVVCLLALAVWAVGHLVCVGVARLIDG